MNKIISTQDRVFMAVVGPSGCGKTELIFKMLIGNTFYPKFNNIIFLYREMQQIYIKMEKTLGVTFKKYANLEFLNSLANCLLIIDDSCEEIITMTNLLNWPLQGVTKTLMLFISSTTFTNRASGLVQ